MPSLKAAQFAWRVIISFASLELFECYPLTGECQLERDAGSDVYSFASNICTSKKCKVLLTSARLRDNKKTPTRLNNRCSFVPWSNR